MCIQVLTHVSFPRPCSRRGKWRRPVPEHKKSFRSSINTYGRVNILYGKSILLSFFLFFLLRRVWDFFFFFLIGVRTLLALPSPFYIFITFIISAVFFSYFLLIFSISFSPQYYSVLLFIISFFSYLVIPLLLLLYFLTSLGFILISLIIIPYLLLPI